MELQTSRLCLRLCSDKELQNNIEKCTDPGLRAAYAEMLQGSLSHPDQRAFYAPWTICLPADGTVAGSIGFHGISDDGTVEIGIGLEEAFQHIGYATEAAQALIEWAQSQPGVTRLEAETEENNVAGQMVLQKLGFTPNGILGEEGPRYTLTGTCDISKNALERMNLHRIPLSSTYNTRDLGGYPIPDKNCSTLRNRVYRTEVPKTISSEDIQLLKENGITTLIDLRTHEEREKFAHALESADGFEYHHVPIYEGRDVPPSVDEVLPTYRTIASSPQLRNVFHRIAEAPEGVMFNCAAGKDRTGVVSILLLYLAGVSEEDILNDYVMTKDCFEPVFARVALKDPVIYNIIMPRKSTIRALFADWKERFSSAEELFLSLGVTADEIQKIRSKLVP